MLENFKLYCQGEKIDSINHGDDPDRFILRVLQGKKFDFKQTANELVEY